MGCGQSKISFSGLRRKKKSQVDKNSENNSRQNENKKTLPQKKTSNDLYVTRNSYLGEDIGSAKRRIANKIRPISGPLQPPLHTSMSQVDFFKMLDEKIASGQDLFSEVEEDIFLARTRTSSSGSKHIRGRLDSRGSKCSSVDNNHRVVISRTSTHSPNSS